MFSNETSSERKNTFDIDVLVGIARCAAKLILSRELTQANQCVKCNFSDLARHVAGIVRRQCRTECSPIELAASNETPPPRRALLLRQ